MKTCYFGESLRCNNWQQFIFNKKVRGFLHLYNGQEAVSGAGALHAMNLGGKDKTTTAYRNDVQPIGMGVDPSKVMAELLGKVTGTSKGMGGSMHIFSKEHGFYGGHGIVGAQIPVGAGMAFADKYFNTGGVTLTYFGARRCTPRLRYTKLLTLATELAKFLLFSFVKTMDMQWVLS